MTTIEAAPIAPLPQVRVQLWTPDSSRKQMRRHLAPCVHLIELERQCLASPHMPSAVNRHHDHSKAVTPAHHHDPQQSDNTQGGRVASLLDLCAQAIVLHQHRQRGGDHINSKNSSSTTPNAPSTATAMHNERHRDGVGAEPLNVELLPCELRAYLSEHWMCVVCQRPTRHQQSQHNNNANGARSGANYPGWCRSCVQRLCYCQVDGCQACNSTWMCLTCGKVCCSTSSHEHSFDHSMSESHMLAWKVGPKAFGEDADTSDPGIWCFACSRYVGETQLHRHLQTLGLAFAPRSSSDVAAAASPHCLEQRR